MLGWFKSIFSIRPYYLVEAGLWTGKKCYLNRFASEWNDEEVAHRFNSKYKAVKEVTIQNRLCSSTLGFKPKLSIVK